MSHARLVVGYCQTEDGRVRNPKLLLQASSHLRASIEQIHAALFEEIRAVDPAPSPRASSIASPSSRPAGDCT
jgi:hypothetical protein